MAPLICRLSSTPAFHIIASSIASCAGLMNTASSVMSGVGNFASGVGSFVSGAAQGVSNLFGGGRDSGGPGVAGMAYGIGRSQADNEIFVPRSEGNFIPNFMDTVQQAITAALGGNSGGLNISGPITIAANSYGEGQQAAAGLMDFMEERRRRGLR